MYAIEIGGHPKEEEKVNNGAKASRCLRYASTQTGKENDNVGGALPANQIKREHDNAEDESSVSSESSELVDCRELAALKK